MTISTETLAALPLGELRDLVQLAEKQLFDRRCHSHLQNVGHCMAEPPHEDGWHEFTQPYGAIGSPSYGSAPQAATIRWRFSDDVVALEHEHEGQRRPGAN